VPSYKSFGHGGGNDTPKKRSEPLQKSIQNKSIQNKRQETRDKGKTSMNKITSTLAGLAIVAGASIAPAMAQGNFTNNNAPFTFSFVPGTSFSVNSLPATFNPSGTGAPVVGTLSITGTGGTAMNFFQTVSLIFNPTAGGTLADNTFLSGAFVTRNPLTGLFGIASNGTSIVGNSFNLAPGTASPVPEASTTVSFGALLALGGLAVVLRRKGVKNAA